MPMRAWPPGPNDIRGLLPPMPFASEAVEEWRDYLIDAAQRMVLTMDVLRRRGNQYAEHMVLGRPPVLSFAYETVMDGRTLPHPCNYMLLRIVPDADHPTVPGRRPIVIVDPRAGHGPGIGGFKADSQVGMALRDGYPCYFVSFLPQPVPGQTLEDVARAEIAFLKTVAERHPDAEDRPVVIGNCQAGWAVAMLGAAAPELMSTVILNGAPLSYWAGEVGHNPMRYLGGLLGGSWLASLASDLGDGVFDGALLVDNFEFLDPANTFWTKPYNLYRNVDTEAERFLGFERWWGGHFLLTKDEIRFIAEELFVGNKLASGAIAGSGGRHVDLRNIRAPIVIFASKADTITPPQQALDWILDLYESVDDIRANGQTIVYMLHKSIGHLGIFVSAKVARREHRAIVDNLDVLSTLPPGLYEMEIAGGDVRFAKRTLDDIRALEDTRREELFFVPVAKVSELNSAFYDMWLGPWMRVLGNEVVAETLRRLNPARFRRWIWSDINPAMVSVSMWSERIRENRAAAGEDNLFRRAEGRFSDILVEGLDHFRDVRDRAAETLFYLAYAPLRYLHRDEEERLLAERRRVLAQRDADAREWLQGQRARMAEGGPAEAVLRILLYLTRSRETVDAGRYRLAGEVMGRGHFLGDWPVRRLREAMRDQSMLLLLDEEAAMAALPLMLPAGEDRRQVIATVHAVVREVGGLPARQAAELAAVERLIAPEGPAEAEAAPAIPPAAPGRKRAPKPAGGRPVH
ncbi:MAG: DUF3141 domain-containing protein [Magnetospirillum sp.]|nr:DUF3141 domain-containing protein [Magnetospirillum sp.]